MLLQEAREGHHHHHREPEYPVSKKPELIATTIEVNEDKQYAVGTVSHPQKAMPKEQYRIVQEWRNKAPS